MQILFDSFLPYGLSGHVSLALINSGHISANHVKHGILAVIYILLFIPSCLGWNSGSPDPPFRPLAFSMHVWCWIRCPLSL